MKKNSVKRIVGMLCSLAIVLQLVVPAFAVATETCDSIVRPSSGTGYLKDDAGNTYIVEGTLVATNMDSKSRSSDNDTLSVTYEYDLSYVPGIVEHDDTASGVDGGYESRVYLTVYYNIKDGLYFLLTAVEGNWVMLTNNTTVTNARLTYLCGATYDQRVFNVAVTNGFSIDTGFTDYTEDDGTYSSVGAALTLTYLMGASRTWTFTLENFVL